MKRLGYIKRALGGIGAVLGCLLLLCGLSACGEKEEASPHICSGVEWRVTAEPSCAAPGSKEFVCSCGKVLNTERISPVHREETVAGAEATCTETGRSAGKRCADCGVTLLKESGLPALGHDYENGSCIRCTATPSEGLTFLSNGDGTCLVSGLGTCTDATLNLPETSPEGETVIGVNYSAFSECETIVAVTFPNTATSIGMFSFDECPNLSRVIIPDSVREIDMYAFGYAPALRFVSMGNGVKEIDTFAFIDCKELTDVQLGSGLEVIRAEAFGGCALRSLTLPESVKEIGSMAFYACDFSSAYIPAGVTSIRGDVFRACENLRQITVNVNNPVYHSSGNCLIETETGRLLQGCSTSVIPADGSVTELADHAFFRCRDLTGLVIPDSVTRIGDMVFYDCDGLTSLQLGKGVERIGENAFWGCIRLVSLVIPAAVSEIQIYAFSDCDALSRVTFENPQGWICGEGSYVTEGDPIDVTDPSANARHLRMTYCGYRWMRK